jgi:hypothetical protein
MRDSVTHAASRNADLLRSLFTNETNVEAFLSRSSLFERARGPASVLRFAHNAGDYHQQSAKLHCLSGVPILHGGRTRSSSRMYPLACSKVYDLRQYNDNTLWGPFMDDGSVKVDWEKLEAILIVLGRNIKNKHLTSRVFSNSWSTPFVGSWSGSYIPTPKKILTSLDERDPYCIAGTWLRVSFALRYFFKQSFALKRFFRSFAS